MASWQNSSGKENHKSIFENVSYDHCIFCSGTQTEIAKKKNFKIMFLKFEHNTDSISITSKSEIFAIYSFTPIKL